MRVEYLNEFLELAHTENYQEAAENLFISQATLSKHIQALETEFNLTLFDRTTRSVHLSEDGKFLLQYATKIASAYDDCKSAIANRLSQKTREHSIRIASTTHIVEYGIADVIADFKRMHYSIKLDVVIVLHNELKPLLRKKKVDFIWIGEPEKESHADSDAFSRIHFHRERLAALIGRASARHYTTPLKSSSSMEKISSCRTIALLSRVFFRIFVSSMALSRIFLLSQEQACSSERQKSIREFPLCLNPWLLHKNQPSMNYFQSPPAQSSTSIFSILNISLSLLIISSSLIMSNPWHLRKHTEFAASVPDRSICCSVNSVSRCARFVSHSKRSFSFA